MTMNTYDLILYEYFEMKEWNGIYIFLIDSSRKTPFTERSDKNLEKPPGAMVPRRRKSRRITFSDAWKQVTLPETNIAPETRPSQKEMSSSNHPSHQWVSVSFPQVSLGSDFFGKTVGFNWRSQALNDALDDVCVECPQQSAQVASNIQAAQELSDQMLVLDEIRNPWKKTWNSL